MLWVSPAVTLLDVSSASAKEASGAPSQPPKCIEIIVKVVDRITYRHGGKNYTLAPVGTKIGLKYDPASGGWSKAVRGAGSCIPSSPSFEYNLAVNIDFVLNIKVATGTRNSKGEVPYVVQLPSRYKYVAGWSRRGLTCGVAGVSGSTVVFP